MLAGVATIWVRTWPLGALPLPFAAKIRLPLLIENSAP
jgi:hypothetical protein